ncbi:hypothetical protein BKP37_07185 [Anaerobacillus alkalilacustris]|uniref:Uncharacterized protein n=2 Tax=Anaerobacillus alkalilacustris TaxID=393763 RepID=A0A1S2LQU0_9BACI|nr:hypothetical protein BKP37_07185 [Anaerobacillus alkalilacustris]
MSWKSCLTPVLIHISSLRGDKGLAHFLIVNSQAFAWLNEILSFIIVATTISSYVELFVTST